VSAERHPFGFGNHSLLFFDGTCILFLEERNSKRMVEQSSTILFEYKPQVCTSLMFWIVNFIIQILISLDMCCSVLQEPKALLAESQDFFSISSFLIQVLISILLVVEK
jgi:hypothetical protein